MKLEPSIRQNVFGFLLAGSWKPRWRFNLVDNFVTLIGPILQKPWSGFRSGMFKL
jgi:hypothetical protein